MEALRRWVRQAERDAEKRARLTDEGAELKRLQPENFELKRATDILRKASAFFAQADLDAERVMTTFIDQHRDTCRVEPISDVLP